MTNQLLLDKTSLELTLKNGQDKEGELESGRLLETHSGGPHFRAGSEAIPQ